MMYALISTVSPGPVIKRKNFAGSPPTLSSAKGVKWIPDNPPAFNPTKQKRTQGQSIAVDATEVPYTIDNIPLNAIKNAKRKLILAEFEKRAAPLVSKYSPTGRETWHEQLKAAQDYEATWADAYLGAMTRDGETVADLAAIILSKRSSLLASSAALIKNSRILDKAVDDATTADEVLAVDHESGWPS